MTDFLFLYENKNREIESLVLLKHMLLSKGYSVTIKNIHYFHGKKIKAKVICIPFAYTNTDIYQYIYCICGKAQKIINFRWEQIYSRKNETDYNGFFYPKEEARKIIQLCWGNKQCENLVDAGVKKTLVHKVGPIHLELVISKGYYNYRDDISSLYKVRKDCKWVLFISSFSNATFTDIEKNEAIKKLGNDRIKFIDISEKSRKTIIEWLSEICKRGYEVIYRPHPSEKMMKDLEECENKYDTFHVITDESVGQWISCCDYVLNWYSTSAIQSIILGKGNTILRPYDIEYSTDVEIFRNANKLCTLKDVFSYLETERNETQDSVINNYYDLETSARDRIINICEDIYYSNTNLEIDYDNILASVGVFKRIKYELLYKLYVPFITMISKCRFSNRFKNSYQMITRNRVSDEEIKIIEDRLEELLS